MTEEIRMINPKTPKDFCGLSDADKRAFMPWVMYFAMQNRKDKQAEKYRKNQKRKLIKEVASRIPADHTAIAKAMNNMF